MTGSGSGSDQMARQDMFSTEVSIWKNEKRVGGQPIGNGDSFSITDSHPITEYLRKLARLRTSNPGLANASMQVRYAKDAALVISKKDETENREYLIAFNNSNKVKIVKVKTATSKSGWRTLLGKSSVKTKKELVTLSIPALSTVVLKANQKIDKTKFKIGKLSSALDFLTGYYETKLSVTSNDILKVKFYGRTSKDQPWISFGTDVSAPYSVYLDPLEFEGKTLEIRTEITNSKGEKLESASSTITIPAP